MESYIGLFLSALLAATIVPFSSEVLFGGMVASGTFNAGSLLLAASTGNILGALVNWGLGRYCLRWRDRKWFPFSEPQLARASRFFNRYGVWSLLFAWVPVIGDPLTFAAGVLKVRFLLFILLVTISKTGRYALLLGLIDHLWKV